MKNKLFISFFLLLFGNSFSQTACVQYDSNFTGYCSEFHPNGKIKWVKEFQDGRAVGIWMNLDEKGELIKQLNTKSKKDSLEKIYLFNQNEFYQLKDNVDTLKKENIIFMCEPEAQYRGGSDALRDFIIKEVKYPQRALDLGIEGRVYVKFIVEKDGSLSNICIQKGIAECPECDEEILRVMHLMPNWIPPKEGGKPIRTHGALPFNFTLK